MLYKQKIRSQIVIFAFTKLGTCTLGLTKHFIREAITIILMYLCT